MMETEPVSEIMHFCFKLTCFMTQDYFITSVVKLFTSQAGHLFRHYKWQEVCYQKPPFPNNSCQKIFPASSRLFRIYMDRRQMLHPLPETTSSVMINSNCPRLVMGFGDVSVHFNSPVWQLAYNDQNWALWNVKSIPALVIQYFMAVFGGRMNTHLEHKVSLRFVHSVPVYSPAGHLTFLWWLGLRQEWGWKERKKDVNLSLSTPWMHIVGAELHQFLTSTVGGGEWSTSRLRPLYPWPNNSGTCWIGGWVGPMAGLNVREKRKSLACPEIQTLDLPARILVTISTTLARKGRVYIGYVYFVRRLC